MSNVWIAVIVRVVHVVASVMIMNLVARRQDYSIPGKTILRCKGHLFTTTWTEGGSLKAVRLGPHTR